MIQIRTLSRLKRGFDRNDPSISDITWGHSEQDGMYGQWVSCVELSLSKCIC